MTTFTFNGVTYDTDDLIGAGSDPSKRYSTIVTAGTGDSLPLFIAMILDGLVDVSNGATTTSTSSVAVGTGSKTFVMTEEIPYYAGDYVLVTRTSDPVNTSLYGTVASRSGTTLNLTITDVNGSGTYTDWTIRLAGAKGATGPTGSVGGLADGSAAAPTLTFTNDTDTGLFLDSNGVLGVAAGGIHIASFSGSEFVYNETGGSRDFRVETDSTTNAFFIDGSADTAAFNVPLSISSITGVTDYHDLFIETPADQDYVWYYNAQYTHTLTDFIGECSAGTCSVDLKINNVTTASLSVSSTSSNDNTFSDATVAAGDDVTITVSSTSSAANLFLQLEHTKDIA